MNQDQEVGLGTKLKNKNIQGVDQGPEKRNLKRENPDPDREEDQVQAQGHGHDLETEGGQSQGKGNDQNQGIKDTETVGQDQGTEDDPGREEEEEVGRGSVQNLERDQDLLRGEDQSHMRGK